MKPADRLRTVEAVIISHKNYGEADRFVTLFSREGGKIRGLAKGVRKMRSRKAAYLEPFMHSKVVLARGRSFWIITQADAIHQNLAIRDSLSKTGQAAYVLELADRLYIEEEPAPAVFRLLVRTLKRINDNPDAFNALRYYELRLLDTTGFRPDLTDCVSCGKAVTAQDQYFSAVEGGVLCPGCGSLRSGMRRVSVSALRFLRHFQRSAYADIASVSIPPGVKKEIDALMHSYLSGIVERKLNAPDFLRKLRRTGAGKAQVQ